MNTTLEIGGMQVSGLMLEVGGMRMDLDRSLSDFERLLTLAHITTYQRKSGVDVAWVPAMVNTMNDLVIQQALNNIREMTDVSLFEGEPGSVSTTGAICPVCGAQPGELHKFVSIDESGML